MAEQNEPIIVDAAATKVLNRWVVDVMGAEHLTVRVRSLSEVDAAVNDAMRGRRRRALRAPVRVNIKWYRCRS